MELNADFSKRAVVHAAQIPWNASPMPGVDRRMLDRLGDEVARATSIVRYAPGSAFSPHVHTGGEEFLVLDGIFQDEHGDFPPGTYVRNPPETSHTPASAPGCMIFVKLWQFDMADRNQLRVDTSTQAFSPDPDRAGVEIMSLFKDGREDVALERWHPEVEVQLDAPGGMEVLVLEGGFTEAGEDFSTHSWLRLPNGSTSSAKAGPDGARVWIKRDHLACPPKAPMA
ncbi:MAG: cupin [Rhizobiales bacterium]|nr:cupin [Hyphomicrobiales bacterium]